MAGLARADGQARLGGTVAQLIGFGSDDSMLTAAVSIGDLDTASTVLANVPGAGTTLDGIEGNLNAATDLRSATMYQGGGPTAVVAWLGYRAPSFPEVPNMDRAASGADRFATFLDGVYDSRRDSPPDRVTVIAHSYGSTLVASALQLTEHRIDDVVAYGSPGFLRGIEVASLNVDEVHATEARADGTAFWGRFFAGPTRTDPRDVSGVQVFSSEAGQGTRAVTTHDMAPDQSGGAVGYLSPDSTTMGSIARIAVGGKP
ncbi:alpha/beta hydrolase family protein [Rathayibacter tanaceti]|uniref:Alpha/beta hydrolase family protein n=2 Tax=Rathayibacter tanaceti TaxID=1671680 RepID=A0ACD2XIZ9_9MICO|nr:Alpha/beta hydrolase family protein [Rathayibacter tanaceti]TCO36700.1 alpha/beta hydrolase family protein [Rathayibacter tanaceti]